MRITLDDILGVISLFALLVIGLRFDVVLVGLSAVAEVVL